MTEQERPALLTADGAAPDPSGAGRAPAMAPAQKRSGPIALIVATLVVALLGIAWCGWQWWETGKEVAGLREELARRLAESDTLAKEGRAVARSAQESLLSLQGKVGALEARVAEAQGQQVALEQMYQEFGRDRDDRVLAEVDQAVTIASQQLQLAGNVQIALVALESAETRLAHVDRPQFLPIRKLLARDIDRLRALPQEDVSALVLKVDAAIAAVDTAPFAFERHPPETVPAQAPPEAAGGALASLAMQVWGEIRSLVRIERLDRSDPALLAPEQGFFLRENLRLRLLNARLALLQHDTRVFREDVRLARQWVERYFDTSARQVQMLQDNLKRLGSAELALELPSLSDTQAAVSALRGGRERAR